MSFMGSLKSAVQSIGKNNKPTYAVMAVAIPKGIFKPITTLTDKKESLETRKYTALREFMSEVVAVPTYWVCGELAAKVAEKTFKNPKDIKIAKTNMMFLGVCVAALVVIPALCSLTVTPFTNMIFKKKKTDNQQKPDIAPKKEQFNVPYQNQNAVKTPYYKNSYNMNTFASGRMKI